MRSSGIIHRLYQLHWYKSPEEPKHPSFEVTLEAAAPIFIVLTLAAAVAVLIMAIEIIVHKRLHSHQST
jgi:hypothetical protein